MTATLVTRVARYRENGGMTLEELLDVKQRTTPPEPPPPGVRLNLGSGIDKKEGWIDVDANPEFAPDVCADAVAHVASLDDSSVDEIYAGHFVEHLDRDVAERFLAACRRVLKPQGRIGVVVPDTGAIMRRYVEEGLDLDDLCHLFLYSTVQETHHKWSYDLTTLRRLLERAGFVVGGEIDRFDDPRLHAGAWWQCGLDGVKPRPSPLRRVFHRRPR